MAKVTAWYARNIFLSVLCDRSQLLHRSIQKRARVFNYREVTMRSSKFFTPKFHLLSLFIASALALPAASAVADDSSDALALRQKAPKKSKEWLEAMEVIAAKDENLEKMAFSVGSSYEFGLDGVPQSYKKALFWYQKVPNDDAAQRGITRINATLSANPALAVNVPITAVNLEKLTKTKKIILGNFVLDFQNQYIQTKSGFNILGLGSTDSHTARNTITLPSANVLQALTDFVYLRVQKKLREQGYEVILPVQLSEPARAEYAKLIEMAPFKSGDELETRDGTSVLYTPTGVSSVVPFSNGCTYYQPKTGHKNIFEGFGAAGKAIGNASSTGMQLPKERMLAVAEKTPIMKVWITVGFGDVEANGAAHMVTNRQNNYVTGSQQTTVANAANAQATSGMFLRPITTRLALMNPVELSYSNLVPSCGAFGSFIAPADGDVAFQLSEKLRDDGGEVASLSNQAASIDVTETYLGNGVVASKVQENSDGSRNKTAGAGQAVQVTSQGSSTSGRVDVNSQGVSRGNLNTQSNYATTIRSDYYATSVIKMVEDVTTGFIGKMGPAAQ